LPPSASGRSLLAALDVSNTRVSVGVFDGPDLRTAFVLAADARWTADVYRVLLAGALREEGLRPEAIRHAVLACVLPPLTEPLEQVCGRLFGTRPLLIGAPGVRTGIRIAALNPREVGPDRVANAVAAYELARGPATVVDFGTVTVFDAVGADGAYLGSAIAPGLALSAEAVFAHTSRLQRVELAPPRSVVGKDTVAALQSGLVYGHAALVDGMVARIAAELGQRAPVIATGELAPLVASVATSIDRVEPRLTLTGLRLLFERNRHGT
jgi:type III pantothenate kinase